MICRKVFTLAASVVLIGVATTAPAIGGERVSSDVAYTLAGQSAEAEQGADPDNIDCADWDDYCRCQCRTWSAKAGAVILSRSQPRATPLILDTVGGGTVLDASAFNFNWAGGVDVSIARQWTDCDAVELRYFGVDGWSATAAVTTPAIWNFPTNPPLFGLGVANIDAVYTSRLYSTELNWRRQTTEWLTVLAGFRWLEFHERLNMNAAFGGNTAVIGTDTDNHLYGGQLGLDARIWNHNCLTVDAYTKAGIYLNSADQNFGVVQAIGPAFNARGGHDSDAFVGEFGASVNYCLSDRLSLRAGYQLLWLESVAVASDQFASVDVINASGIDVGGSAFYHGATVGMEYAW